MSYPQHGGVVCRICGNRYRGAACSNCGVRVTESQACGRCDFIFDNALYFVEHICDGARLRQMGYAHCDGCRAMRRMVLQEDMRYRCQGCGVSGAVREVVLRPNAHYSVYEASRQAVADNINEAFQNSTSAPDTPEYEITYDSLREAAWQVDRATTPQPSQSDTADRTHVEDPADAHNALYVDDCTCAECAAYAQRQGDCECVGCDPLEGLRDGPSKKCKKLPTPHDFDRPNIPMDLSPDT